MCNGKRLIFSLLRLCVRKCAAFAPLSLSTTATKLEYYPHEYWVEVALRVDENGTCTRRKWHFGWAKVALAHQKLHFCGFQGEQRGRKGGIYRGFSLQNGCSGRWCLNNICIASYGVGAKFFTTNLMSVDLPLNTPKTRKPIAERTYHKWHGYTTRGCSCLCCTKQLLLLPRNARNAQNLLAEKGLPRMARIDTDCYGALFSHRIQNTEFGSVEGVSKLPI